MVVAPPWLSSPTISRSAGCGIRYPIDGAGCPPGSGPCRHGREPGIDRADVVGLSLLLRRSAQMANRALGLGRSQPRIKAQGIFRSASKMWRASTRRNRNSGSGDLLEAAWAQPVSAQDSKAFCWLGHRNRQDTLGQGDRRGGRGPFFDGGLEFVELFVGVGASRVRDFSTSQGKPPALCSSMRSMPSVVSVEQASVEKR